MPVPYPRGSSASLRQSLSGARYRHHDCECGTTAAVNPAGLVDSHAQVAYNNAKWLVFGLRWAKDEVLNTE